MGAAVITKNKKPIGIITDGDIRRMFSKKQKLNQCIAKDIMSVNPLTIKSDILASEALEIMNQKKISQLVVVKNDDYAGLIHLHNIINEGLA